MDSSSHDAVNVTTLSNYRRQDPVQSALRVSEIAYVYVQPCIFIVGFILNVINSCIFCRRVFVAPAYLMMLALSITDAITLGLRTPQGLT